MKASRTARIILAILFAGMLATPARYPEGFRARAKKPRQNWIESQALARYGFHLQEVSQQAGIHFTHQAPSLDGKLKGIMPRSRLHGRLRVRR